MQAFDGVTTTLDLEAGILPVASWYRKQAARGRVLNYGASANWAFARIGAMTGSNAESSLEAFGNAMRDRRWIDDVASEAQVAGILERLAGGLNEGAIGIGILNAYAPGAGVQELTAVCQLAAAHDVPTFTHVAYMSRIDPESAAEAYIRLIGYAGATGAHMHICHFNSSSKTDVERCAVLVAKAQAQGLPITLEAYPYGTGSTVLAAAFFSDPEFVERNGTDYDSVQRVTDGRRFRDRENCSRHRPPSPPRWCCGISWIPRTIRTIVICWICRCCIPVARSRRTPCPGRCRWQRLHRRRLAAACGRHVASAFGGLLHALHPRMGPRAPDGFAAGRHPQMRADPGGDSWPQHARHAFQREAAAGRGCRHRGVRLRYAHRPGGILGDESPVGGVRHLMVSGQPLITDGVLDVAARPGQPVRRPFAAT